MPRFVAWLGVAYLAWVPPSPLCAQQAKLRETLRGHPTGVLYLAFGPDGKTLASGSEDGTFKLWDVDTGKVKAALAVSYPMALSPDGKTVASSLAPGGFDLRLMSWGDGSGVPTSGTNLVIVGIDNNGLLHLRIFDAGGNRVTDTDETKLPGTQAGAISALKQQIPGLSPPNRLTDTLKDRVINTLKSIVGQTPPGFAGSTYLDVMIWDVKTATITHSLEHVDNSIRATSLTFSPDGKTVAGGLGGNFYRSFQQGGVVQWVLTRRGTYEGYDLRLMPWGDGSGVPASGKKLVILGVDGFDLRLMSWGDGSGVPTSGTNLVIVGIDNNGLLHLRIFDAGGNRITDTDETRISGLSAKVGNLTRAGAISTLKQRLQGLLPPHVLTSAEKAQVISEATSIVGEAQFLSRRARDISTLKQRLQGFLPPHVLTANEKAQVISEATRFFLDDRLRNFLEYHTHDFFPLSVVNGRLHIRSFDADGKLTDTDETKLEDDAAIAALRSRIPGLLPPHVLTSAETTQLQRDLTSLVLKPYEFKNADFYRWVGVSSITFGPDGKTLAWTVDWNSDGIEEGVHLWDGHRETTILKKEKSPVPDKAGGSCPAFSPDGKTLAMGNGDTIKLWDVTGRKDIATLRGHSGPVNSLAFRPDGKTLASGSADKTIKLWDVPGGKHTATLQGHSDGVTSVAFSPDGQILASGSRDRTISLWNILDKGKNQE
jgi:WD40 repeat protein